MTFQTLSENFLNVWQSSGARPRNLTVRGVARHRNRVTVSTSASFPAFTSAIALRSATEGLYWDNLSCRRLEGGVDAFGAGFGFVHDAVIPAHP